MRKDVNFFAPYKGKAKKENKEGSNKKVIIIFGTIVVLFIVITLAVNLIRMHILNTNIENYTAELNDPAIQQKLSEYKDVDNKINILNKYDSALTSVGSAVDKRDVVSNDILKQLSSVLPSEVWFKSFNIVPGNITVQAVSKNRQAIGEVEHNLKQLTNVDDVYIGSITALGGDSVDGQFSFDIKITLKGAK